MAIAVAEARVASMASRIKVLEAQVVDAYVYAPFDGVVTEKAAEIGEIVAPISIGGSMARGSIVTIADWHSLQAEVDVAEAYISRVQVGGRAAITADAFPDKSFPGKVRRILPRANRTKATVQVRVDFVKEPNGVLPDMGVRVKFLAPDAPAGAEAEGAREKNGVPQAAVLGTPESPYVWTVADGLARKQSVQAGATRDGMTEIKSGLVPGQKVVTRGAENLTQDGQKVRVGE
jgi:RND family efflux transporter MFP subunit